MKRLIRCSACGRQVPMRGDRIGRVPFCSLQCNRSRLGHIARFLWFVDPLNTTDCWKWKGKIGAGGYGGFGATTAHRFSYQSFIGPISQNMSLDHLCRVRSCCNPYHLEPVTCRENLLRGETHAAKNSAKTHCPRGHEYSPDNTYLHKDGRRVCVECRRTAQRKAMAA